MEDFQGRAGLRAERVLVRVERWYLAALRVALLLLATGLILYGLWLAVTGMYQWSQDAKQVSQRPVEIAAKEVAALPREAPEPRSAAGDALKQEKAFYRDFTTRYHRIYGAQFERFNKASDRRLSKDEFDARFVDTASRLRAVSAGELNFAEDRDRLDRLFTTMSEVAALPETVQRLQRYQRSSRTTVSRVISGTRAERYCSYYGYYIDACITYDTRQVPFKRTVTEQRLPDGVLEPGVLFQRQQDRFLDLLATRTRDNVLAADAERDRIIAGNASGAARLWTSLSVAAGFLALMFLFLLIAIERHQRRLAAAIVTLPSDPVVIET